MWDLVNQLRRVGPGLERLRREGAFAHLCGVAPMPASSERINRHRLNRGGNRATKLRPPHADVEPHHRGATDLRIRGSRGKTKPEIIRCLKRYIAGEIYRAIKEAPSFSLLADAGLSPAATSRETAVKVPTPFSVRRIGATSATRRANRYGVSRTRISRQVTRIIRRG
jgi:hypothetical protein